MARIGVWLAVGLLCLAAAVFGAEKKVFLLESYHSDYQWDHDYRAALYEKLSGRCELAVYTLDSKRLPREQVLIRADEARKRIAAFQPDLVIVGDDAALQLVGSKLAEAGAPVIYLGINNNPRNYFQSTPSNISGVLERPLILRNIFELGRMVPGLKRALALFDSDLTSRIIRDEAFVGRDNIRLGGIDVDIALPYTFAEWQQRVLQAPQRYQAIWVGLYFTLRDDNGKVVPSDEVMRWTAANSKLPMFAFWNFAVGKGKAIGGRVLTGREQGLEAARMAQAMLFENRSLSSLFPVTPSEGEYLFSRSELARSGLSLPLQVARKAHWVE